MVSVLGSLWQIKRKNKQWGSARRLEFHVPELCDFTQHGLSGVCETLYKL